MRLLLIGGGGTVGGQVIPHLLVRHDLHVLDPSPPAHPGVTHHRAGVTDPGALDALAGMDAVVHLASVVPRGPEVADSARVTAAFGVNVGSVYATLVAARRHHVPRFVHVSTMSVFSEYGRRPVDVSLPPDSTEPYGLSKRMAEEVCRTTAGDLTGVSLRLAHPTPDDDWPLWRPPAVRPPGQDEAVPPPGPSRGPDGGVPLVARPPVRLRFDDGTPVVALAGSDTAAAIEAALRYGGPYRAFAVTGDPRTVTGDDTPAVLGWAPTGRSV
ncbi:NAD-dependent epimerase/dehydratase family protein [Streptosporangium sp. KLBMP 9127]|nr:NAD(P)-dependent oxidoreductase [Streptosporangium sp. KLBMP 9127]